VFLSFRKYWHVFVVVRVRALVSIFVIICFGGAMVFMCFREYWRVFVVVHGHVDMFR
jgi:hypothetical protein